MPVFDATILLLFLEPDARASIDPETNEPLTNAKARIDHPIETLENRRIPFSSSRPDVRAPKSNAPRRTGAVAGRSSRPRPSTSGDPITSSASDARLPGGATTRGAFRADWVARSSRRRCSSTSASSTRLPTTTASIRRRSYSRRARTTEETRHGTIPDSDRRRAARSVGADGVAWIDTTGSGSRLASSRPIEGSIPFRCRIAWRGSVVARVCSQVTRIAVSASLPVAKYS